MPTKKHSLARIGFNILANDERTKFSTKEGYNKMNEILSASGLSSMEALNHIARSKLSGLNEKKDDAGAEKRLENLTEK